MLHAKQTTSSISVCAGPPAAALTFGWFTLSCPLLCVFLAHFWLVHSFMSSPLCFPRSFLVGSLFHVLSSVFSSLIFGWFTLSCPLLCVFLAHFWLVHSFVSSPLCFPRSRLASRPVSDKVPWRGDVVNPTPSSLLLGAKGWAGWWWWGTSFTSVVSQRRSYGHCLCDSVLRSSWDSNCVVL